MSIKEDSFEYCLLFVLAVVYSVLYTIVRNCCIMFKRGDVHCVVDFDNDKDYGGVQWFEIEDTGEQFEPKLNVYDLVQRGHTSALNTGIYPTAKPRLFFDVELDAIHKLTIIRYLDRFSVADLRKECKLGRVNVKGCKTKASVIAEMIWQLMDGTGITGTQLCLTVRSHYEFMKGREHG